VAFVDQQVLRRILQPFRRTPFHPQWHLARINGKALVELRKIKGRVLDIGCADRWIENALDPACEYIGLDYPATGGALYHAKPDVFSDAAQLPFANTIFDAVVMLEVMEHLRQPIPALQELARVLRPGGTLILSVPFLYPVHDAPFDFQRLTKYGLERDLGAIGLELRHIERMGGALETAGLLVCLALAGGLMEALQTRRSRLLWAPVIAFAIPGINLLTALAQRIFPDWSGMSQGHWLVANKSIVIGDVTDM
jgi:SAM-dependent methyltransferase